MYASKNNDKLKRVNLINQTFLEGGHTDCWELSCKFQTVLFFVFFAIFFHKPNQKNNQVWFVQKNNLDKIGGLSTQFSYLENMLFIQPSAAEVGCLFVLDYTVPNKDFCFIDIQKIALYKKDQDFNEPYLYPIWSCLFIHSPNKTYWTSTPCQKRHTGGLA